MKVERQIESINCERLKIETESMLLEKISQRILNNEVEISVMTEKKIQEIDDKILDWKSDIELTAFFLQQKEILLDMKKKQYQFQEDFQNYVNSRKKQLFYKEEKCEQRALKLSQ